MMNTDFNLDFFYYLQLPGLDAEDPQEVANRPHRYKFIDYVKQAPIVEAIELLVFVYTKKFAYDQPWFSIFKERNAVKPIYPDYLDTEVDIYLGKEETSHEDINYVIFKNIYISEYAPPKLDWIELGLFGNQTLTELSDAVTKGFKDLEITRTTEGDTEVFTPNEESPIVKITLTSTTFRMTMDPDKWVYYA